MRAFVLFSLIAALAGCLPPPNPRTIDISRLPSREAEQIEANARDGKTPWITIEGRVNLAEVFAR